MSAKSKPDIHGKPKGWSEQTPENTPRCVGCFEHPDEPCDHTVYDVWKCPAYNRIRQLERDFKDYRRLTEEEQGY